MQSAKPRISEATSSRKRQDSDGQQDQRRVTLAVTLARLIFQPAR